MKKRRLLLAAIFLPCLVHSNGASLNVCNISKKHTISLAISYYAEGGNGFVKDDFPFHSKGWFSIEPDTCAPELEDFPITSEFWFRIQAEDRLIRELAPGSNVPNVRLSEREFCADPQEKFVRNYQTLYNTAASCTDEMPLAAYPIRFQFYSGGFYMMNIDPDKAIAKQKPEPVQVIKHPSEPLDGQFTTKVGGVAIVAPLSDAFAKKFFHSPVLECSYGRLPNTQNIYDVTVRFWYKSAPADLVQWIAQDKTKDVGLFGLRGVGSCPSTSYAALKLHEDMYKDYLKAAGLANR